MQEQGQKQDAAVATVPKDSGRRKFLKTAAAAGAAVAASSAVGPFIKTSSAATTWKLQTVWDAGTSGYTLFEKWCNGFAERSGGELILKPFPAKSIAADNNALFEAVSTGVLQGMQPFTIYWAGKIPASVFLSSYPMGPDQPAQWDIMFDALGMKDLAREIYAKHGLFYVGHVHHDANIIHSKKPVTTLEDFKGLKLRAPGGMIAEAFQALGASTVSLPGSDIFPALEKGTIDAADYVGPAVNWDLGFAQVAKYILFGPPGVMSLYQPVDLMDITVNLGAWKRLSPELQTLFEEEVRTYSYAHYIGIQKANVVALKKFEEAGCEVSRLSQDDAMKWRQMIVPIWYNWAKKDADATRVFKLQLDFMMNDLMGYVTPDDIKGQTL
ncbi:TRAP transporter substrate-binding protein DctP [Desulfofustis glycolicus]|uniref:Tat (Twin-arginine translocation) pathway signal sequence n=1 Tax=Desulfofustis glycolicus DSM 9705 TaxID=1121409 RepID=A0A1M5T6E1_9BACT|nr:TRAP transporter substrate-binding protein DctP [Desulfofustis glycolicus]MCB2215386.1 TRAP transporter substrate-binding protein DctP [Desulfobulbaceae bacterium]SHH46294.1 Tat (twin-arginine translocation) pathway signal sequence [Desulfofustis glycolicus DSM 9705]